ncbi:hypothetical protein VTK73DRAFT_9977 [Phialemonium thermophilum]|uniref:CAP-Gly domain-containing protein n=1 Tax=Phialemonium thermophilum TaxID=223376 RepID=A0ABR3VZ38_9PEZI
MASSQRAVGQRISFDGALCTIRYIGEVAGTQGTWLGVEWDDPSRGKHDGQHKGVRYFTCRTHSPTAASFVRPTRPADPPQDFLSALHEKYASDLGGNEGRYAGSLTGPQPIVISGKVAEEVGFDKIRRKQSQLDELKIVILDGMRIDSAYSSASPSVHDSPMSGQARLDQPTQDVRRRIRGVCPKVIELDLSRNLFTRFKTVVEICSELEDLRSLKIKCVCPFVGQSPFSSCH